MIAGSNGFRLEVVFFVPEVEAVVFCRKRWILCRKRKQWFSTGCSDFCAGIGSSGFLSEAVIFVPEVEAVDFCRSDGFYTSCCVICWPEGMVVCRKQLYICRNTLSTGNGGSFSDALVFVGSDCLLLRVNGCLFI